MVGGQLSKPHERWPRIFSHPFWVAYPYFLPCAFSAAFSATCFVVAAFFLKEVRNLTVPHFLPTPTNNNNDT